MIEMYFCAHRLSIVTTVYIGLVFVPFTALYRSIPVHSVCFVVTDLRSLKITCIIHMCYLCLVCESKMASISYLIVWAFQ